ncbi:MAG: 4Fe-4S binding protein [Bacteroidetes bacterium]|nr:4Fe-4S binding protein [Bacteroidota bacterium]
MKSFLNYIAEIFKGIWSLLTGMKVTAKYFFTPWRNVTQQYPENRDKLVFGERYRGELVMPHNESNEHACTGCGICELNCPNGSIEIISKSIMTEEGKKKRIIDLHIYHLGMCTFCNLCVRSCPSDAISFTHSFEHAYWDRKTMTKVLNQPGSKIMANVKE